MRLPKKDQQILAEAYESVANSTISNAHNTDRQLNQINLKLSNRGYKPLDDIGKFGISSADGSIFIAPWQNKYGTAFGVITQQNSKDLRSDGHYNTYKGIIFMPNGIKDAKNTLDKKFSTLEEISTTGSGIYDVFQDPDEAAQQLDGR